MTEYRVAIKNLDGTHDYVSIEADQLEIEPDPVIFKGAIPRYYVLKTELGDEVGRFNEKDVAGAFIGEVQLNLRPSGDGDKELLSP